MSAQILKSILFILYSQCILASFPQSVWSSHVTNMDNPADQSGSLGFEGSFPNTDSFIFNSPQVGAGHLNFLL